jgi:hypothetical protein
MRPSEKEIGKRIKEAQKALAEGRVAVLNQEVIASDALELGYLIEEDFGPLLAELLDALAPAHYTGTRPPQRSYESKIKHQDLVVFEVTSTRLNCRLYFKFAVRHGILWVVSLHKSRGRQEVL